MQYSVTLVGEIMLIFQLLRKKVVETPPKVPCFFFSKWRIFAYSLFEKICQMIAKNNDNIIAFSTFFTRASLVTSGLLSACTP